MSTPTATRRKGGQTMQPTPGKQHRHKGQALVMFAISLVLLLGFIGLSIDVGYYLSQRRAVQNAADAAAMAGGKYLSLQMDRTSATTKTNTANAARAYAATNGYTVGAGTTIDVDSTATEVTVTVQHDVPKFFSSVIFSGPWTVEAVATSRLKPNPSPYAMIALGPSPNPGIVFGGLNSYGVTVDCDPPSPGCGSIGSNANITINGNVKGDISGVLGAVGTVTSVPGTFKADGGIFTNQGLIDDPFLPIARPECDDPMKMEKNPEIAVDGDDLTLSPGYYTALNVKNKKVTMKPGVYCFDVSLDLGNGELKAGSGVLLYFRNGASIADSPTNAKMTIADAKSQNNPDIDWTRDPWYGDAKWNKVAVWVDNTNPNGTCASGNQVKLNGNGDLNIHGAIYAPCSHVELGGSNNTVSMAGVVIGNDIKISGNVNFKMTTSNDYLAGPGYVYLVR